MIQEAFQCRLNASAHAPAMPHQQNAYGILGQTTVDSDNGSADTVFTQVVALTYHSQLTTSTAANLIQRAEQQFAMLYFW
jgi:hypothetical protein